MSILLCNRFNISKIFVRGHVIVQQQSKNTLHGRPDWNIETTISFYLKTCFLLDFELTNNFVYCLKIRIPGLTKLLTVLLYQHIILLILHTCQNYEQPPRTDYASDRLCPSHYCQPPWIQKAIYTSKTVIKYIDFIVDTDYFSYHKLLQN